MISHLQILFCAVLWGLAGPFIRWSGLPAQSVAALRFTIPLFLAYGWLKWVEKDRLHPMGRGLALASLLTALGNALYIVAFSFTSISNVLLLLYTRPVLATTMASLLLHEKVSARVWSLLFLSFSGALLIMSSHEFSFSNRDAIGMAISLCAAFTTGLAWAVIKKHGYGERSASEILFYQHLVGAILVIPLVPQVLLEAPLPGIGLVGLYAILIGFVGTLFYFKGLRHVPLSHAMPLTYAELVVAVSIGILAFGDPLPWQAVAGGMLIIISSLGTIFVRPRTSETTKGG